jgi:hypothetical protein
MNHEGSPEAHRIRSRNAGRCVVFSGGVVLRLVVLIIFEKVPVSLRRGTTPEGFVAPYDSSEPRSSPGGALGVDISFQPPLRVWTARWKRRRAVLRRWGGIYVPPCLAGRLSLVR